MSYHSPFTFTMSSARPANFKPPSAQRSRQSAVLYHLRDNAQSGPFPARNVIFELVFTCFHLFSPVFTCFHLLSPDFTASVAILWFRRPPVVPEHHKAILRALRVRITRAYEGARPQFAAVSL